MNTARNYLGGIGTQTAAVAAGWDKGSSAGETETYDGSTWTEVSDLNNARKELSSFGSSTSATAYGGYDTAVRGYTEDYDGTSWTEVADLSTARYKLGGAGSTGGSGLAVGGTASPGVQSAVEEWTQSHNVKTITD